MSKFRLSNKLQTRWCETFILFDVYGFYHFLDPVDCDYLEHIHSRNSVSDVSFSDCNLIVLSLLQYAMFIRTRIRNKVERNCYITLTFFIQFISLWKSQPLVYRHYRYNNNNNPFINTYQTVPLHSLCHGWNVCQIHRIS